MTFQPKKQFIVNPKMLGRGPCGTGVVDNLGGSTYALINIPGETHIHLTKHTMELNPFLRAIDGP